MNRKKDIEQLFRQHYAKMYNLARCILSDDDESKDVVSEVFAQILADDVVLVPGSEEGYLMRSVRNRCLNLIAHKSVKERVAKLLLDDSDVILSEETDERLDRLMLLIEIWNRLSGNSFSVCAIFRRNLIRRWLMKWE